MSFFDLDKIPNEYKKVAKLFNKVVEFEKTEYLKEDFTENNENIFSHLSNCFIKIEPVQVDEPITLFGSKTKNSVFNKITLYQAIFDKNKNEYFLGKQLLESYINDESLSMGLLKANGSSVPCTYSKVLEEDLLVDHYKNKISNAVDRFHDSLSDDKRLFNEYCNELESLKESVFDKSSIPKKDLDRIKTLTNILHENSISNIFDISSSLVKELNKDFASLKTEMSSTIEKISKYYKDIETLKLSNKEESVDFNYLRWKMNGKFSKKEIQELLYLFENSSDYIFSNEAKNIDHDLINDYKKSLSEKRISKQHYSFESNGCLSLFYISGENSFFKTNYKSESYVELRFSSAYYKREASKNVLLPINNLFTLRMTHEDFLILLRGNSLSDHIPCTLSKTGFTEHQIPFVSYNIKEKENRFINTSFSSKKVYISASSEFTKIKNELSNFISSGKISKKGDKEKLFELIELFIKSFYKNLDILMKIQDKDKGNIINHFQDDVSKSIEEFSKKIPSIEAKKALLKMIGNKK